MLFELVKSIKKWQMPLREYTRKRFPRLLCYTQTARKIKTTNLAVQQKLHPILDVLSLLVVALATQRYICQLSMFVFFSYEAKN